MVVMDEVKVRFGPDKEIAHRIKADASAEMAEEVVAGDIVLAIVTAAWSYVEANVLRSDSRHQFRADVLVDARHPNGVEVIEERTEGHADGSGLIEVLAPSPGKFRAKAKVVGEQKIRAETWRQPTADRLGGIVAAGVRSGRSMHGVESECGIDLLPVSRRAEQG